MAYTKQEIEIRLKEFLDDMLQGSNQDGSIINLEYDEANSVANVKLSVIMVEEDDYIGFKGY